VTAVYDVVYEKASLTRASALATGSVGGTVQYHAALTGNDLVVVSGPRDSAPVGEGSFAPWLAEATERLLAWLDQPENWDNYGSRPISVKDVSQAHYILRVMARFNVPPPHIVGTSDGGVILEWASKTVSIQITVEQGEFSLYVRDDESGSEWEGPLDPVPNHLPLAILSLEATQTHPR